MNRDIETLCTELNAVPALLSALSMHLEEDNRLSDNTVHEALFAIANYVERIEADFSAALLH